MELDKKYFFDQIRGKLHFGRLNKEQVKNYELILEECKKLLLDKEQIAYILATVYWETAKTIKPIKEYGRGRGRKYGKPTGPFNKVYYGRGFVQLTWLANYEKQSKIHGVNFVKYPDQVMYPQYATKILVHGMVRGDFTGRGLQKYINENKKDYIGARWVVNGKDKAHLIASLAEKYESSIKEIKLVKQKPKTLKREAACTSLVGVAATGATAVVGDSDSALKVLEIIIGPFMLFATSMFTADWVGKQSPWSKDKEDD